MNDRHHDDEAKLKELLRAYIGRIGADDAPPHDLWPRVLRRLDEGAQRAPWFDWALLGATLMWLLLFPKTISVLLYHL